MLCENEKAVIADGAPSPKTVLLCAKE